MAWPVAPCTVLFAHEMLQEVHIKIYVGLGVDVIVVFELVSRLLPSRMAHKTRFSEGSRTSSHG